LGASIIIEKGQNNMDNTFCWTTIIVGIICAFIGGNISASKGRSQGEGFALGLILGIIGLIIVAVLPKNEEALEELKLTDGTSKKCPYCAEIIKREATVCRFCGKDLPVVDVSAREVRITKAEFSQLTYRQKFAVTEYGYLLSPGDAETVGRMLGNFREKDIPSYVEENGKKVLSFEQ
jgi:uncharacterized membrane protein YeaQ/YmgE (transglycosylase-associated protein family)